MKATPFPTPPRAQSLVRSSGNPLTRRQFLGRSAAAALTAPFILPAGLRAASPNSKLHHACIGVGGMGWNDFHNFLSHPRAQIVALCDVDANHLARAAKVVPGARTYSDWRELLEKEGDKIDSVNVTVPDHMHFDIAYYAIERGKHVYCQKPMCHDIREVRVLTQRAVAKGVVTQLGTQGAASAGDRATVKLLQQGAIGKIRHGYLCSNRPGAVKDYRLKGPRPAHGEKPPASLKWDLWIGTAPMRPFAPGIYHPTKWRAWQDFGTGWSGDIGCHIFDAVWKGLSMQSALGVEAEVQPSWQDSPARRADTWPQADHIRWTFPGNHLTESSELTCEWFDGSFYPPEAVRALDTVDSTYPSESAMMIGTDGALLHGLGQMPLLFPAKKFKNYPMPKVSSGNHYHLFVDACLGGAKTESNFARVGPMVEAVLLGTVAIRTPGQQLQWDAPNLRFPNFPEAERLLSRRYREGWKMGIF